MKNIICLALVPAFILISLTSCCCCCIPLDLSSNVDRVEENTNEHIEDITPGNKEEPTVPDNKAETERGPGDDTGEQTPPDHQNPPDDETHPSDNKGEGESNETHRNHNDFTGDEHQLFKKVVGTVIPFIPNDEYYVEQLTDEYGDYINLYTYGNTQAEFDAYRALFSSYTYDGSEVDEYGDTWYYYSQGDVCIEMAYYYYEGEYVVDVYVYLADDGSGSEEDTSGDNNPVETAPIETEPGGETEPPYFYSFTSEEQDLFQSVVGTVIPFISNEEYYVEKKTDEYGDYISFYTYGNSQAEFDDYRTLFSSYTYDGSEVDEYGDTWYYYSKGDVCVDMAYYYYEGDYIVDVIIYLATDDSGSEGETDSGVESPIAPDSSIITNDGKGLPQSANGIYDVDFTKGNYVQNVTDQGYYIDGCPTTGSPKVLVIPVEFSDVTAASKGYTIDKLEKIFNGTGNDTIYHSVHDYFFISSYSQLDLDVTVVDSWFRPQYTSSHYASETYDYYGDEVAIGDQLILDEALAYLSGVMDLSEFDSDSNGIIDAVVMVNTLDIDSNSDFQWAYRYWNIYTDDEGYYYEYDSVSANDYIWMCYEFMFEGYDEETSETNYDHSNPLNPYTFIHEFSHILGADDYYDTAYEGSPMGGFDMMDGMMGDHNPYTKFNYGWITSSRLIVTDSTVTVTLDAFGNSGDTLILACNWDESLGAYQEYYVIMYYTATGLNSGEGGYFMRDGIVVYHINSNLFAQEYDGETYYDVYNNNTSASDQYGTADNLIEYVKSAADNYTYTVGDSLPTVTDDMGNTLGYTFTVDSLTESTATLTFTRN